MANLSALYVFVSSITGNTYILNVQTGPLQTLSQYNFTGYPIVSGAVTVVQSDGKSHGPYPVPPGQTPFIFNGLWTVNPEGGIILEGIDRLYINFDPNNTNTMIVASSSVSATIVGFPLAPVGDSATLVHYRFPPQ